MNLEDLRYRVAEWLRDRDDLDAREDEGDYPRAAEWEISDDQAVDIVRDLAVVLGILHP